MNDRHHTSWTRLVTAARRAPHAGQVDADVFAPAGFATRVVAHSALRPASGVTGGLFGAGFERLAARALGLASACAVAVTIWGSLPATAEARSTDPTMNTDAYLDPVGDYLAAVQSS